MVARAEFNRVKHRLFPVMAGLVPDIHVDPRDKPGDDGRRAVNLKGPDAGLEGMRQGKGTTVTRENTAGFSLLSR